MGRPCIGFTFAPLPLSRTHRKSISSRRWLACASQPVAERVPWSADASQLVAKVNAKTQVSDDRIEQLRVLGEIMLAANKTTNLTAVRTQDGYVARHVVDGLGLLPVLDKLEPNSLIDIGSGAGFPGLILAVCRPTWQVTLVDSVRKKTRFQEQVIRELGLRNVEAVWGRAEEIGQDPAFRETFDVSCARAVAKMPVLAELTLPLVRRGGALVAQKSIERYGEPVEVDSAQRAFKMLGGELEKIEMSWTCDLVREVMPLETDDDMTRLRASVIVRKVAKTSRNYPRQPGTPKKTPL